MEVVIEGSVVRCERDVHRILDEQLDFGEYYGWNLGALRDRLGTDIERPLKILWRHAAKSRAAIGEASFTGICSVLSEVEAQDRSLGVADPLQVVVEM